MSPSRSCIAIDNLNNDTKEWQNRIQHLCSIALFTIDIKILTHQIYLWMIDHEFYNINRQYETCFKKKISHLNKRMTKL